MALIVDLAQTYDQSTANDYFIAEGIHMISPTDTPLQLLFPKVQVNETKVEWIEDELTGLTTHVEATCATTNETTLNIHTDDGADKFPTDVATYNVVIRVDNEYMLVTGKSTDRLTVTRGYASTTPATHAVNAPVHIVSQLEHEGSDSKATQMRARTRPSNYLQTFSRTIKVSGVQEQVKKLGGITSEVDYQIQVAMKQLALELEKTILLGVAAQAGNGSSTFRTMAGLWAFITTNKTTDSGSIDTEALEADIKSIWDQGGVPRAIVTTGALSQAITNLYADRVRTDVLTTLGGANITSIVNPLGEGPIAIIPHRLMKAGAYFILDTARIALGYLRPFGMEQLDKTGDYERRLMRGDYTLEMMNEKAHAYREGFSE